MDSITNLTLYIDMALEGVTHIVDQAGVALARGIEAFILAWVLALEAMVDSVVAAMVTAIDQAAAN